MAAITALLAGAASLLWLADAQPTNQPQVVTTVPTAVPPAPQPVQQAQSEPAEPLAIAPVPLVEETPAPSEAATPPPAQETVAAPPPPEPAALTPAAPPDIVVNYASDQPGAREAAERVAALLSARGYNIAGIRGVPGRIRQPSTRHAGDRDAAEAVNRAFEQALQAYQPGAVSRIVETGSDADTIEVWVPDSAAGASRPLRMDRPPG